MTDTEPTPGPTLDFATWDRKDREYASRTEELLAANKAALFNALSGSRIELVTVVFDGFGDSGQIENIEVKAGDETISLPSKTIEIVRPVWGSPEVERQTLPVREAIEALAYDFLGQTHGGWENNDGAYGDFTFGVADRTITLNYNERHMEFDYSQHVF